MPHDLDLRSCAHTVIALHCSGSSGRQWEAYRARLPAGTCLAAPDLLGSRPGEAWPADPALLLETEARRLAPLLYTDPRGVHLVGHSYGGAVALELARRWPQRVRSLTLYEPVRFALLRGDGDGTHWDDIVRVGRRIGALTRVDRPHEAAEVFVDYWSGPGSWQALPATRREAVAARMPKVRAEFETLFADPVPLADHAALAMPLHLVCGTRSPAPARRVVLRLAGACRRATLATLPLGHMGPLEDPAGFAAEWRWALAPGRLAEAA